MKKSLPLNEKKSNGITAIGIACHLREHKLCWLINKALGIKLQRIKDYELCLRKKSKEKAAFQVFFHEEKIRDELYFLMSNQSEAGNLLPGPEIHYLLLIKDLALEGGVNRIMEKIKQNNSILAVFLLNPEKYPETEILFSDLELLQMEYLKELKAKHALLLKKPSGKSRREINPY